MTNAAFFPPTAAPRREETAEYTSNDPPRRYRGPVLMGDLTASICGRPLLLMHWDDPPEP